MPNLSPDTLIVCPSCDALYEAPSTPEGERTWCGRCHRVLIAPQRGATAWIVGLALVELALLYGALFFPFLEIRKWGFSSSTSVFDTAMELQGALGLAVVGLVAGVPLVRLLLLLYVLGPLQIGWANLPGVGRAFRWAEALRPWSMAEIFALGTGVALVKIADLARVDPGPAFFMFAGLVAVSVVREKFLCRWSIWQALDQNRP